MKAVIGLGNPGKKYNGTRHNIGFDVIDRYLGFVKWNENNDSLIYEKIIDGNKIIFIKPLLYMNLSGKVVKRIVDFYKINIDDILVIQDDIDIEIGKYKIKNNSSSGGHNGINSIIECLNTKKFMRLKIGVSKVEKINIINYVLGKFSTTEKDKIINLQKEFNVIIDNFINNK